MGWRVLRSQAKTCTIQTLTQNTYGKLENGNVENNITENSILQILKSPNILRLTDWYRITCISKHHLECSMSHGIITNFILLPNSNLNYLLVYRGYKVNTMINIMQA